MWNIEFAAGMLQMGTIYPAGITSFMWNTGGAHPYYTPTQSTESTCIVSVYNVGRQALKGERTMYQQQLWYIQNHGLLTTPARLFTK